MTNFGIVNHIMVGAKSKPMFSLFLQMNTLNNRDNLSQIRHFLSPTKGIPQIFAIFKTISIYLRVFLVESKPNPNIQDWTPTLQQNFSNNTGYTFQLQVSTQPTMLRMVLDHNPNAFMTV